jgi:hypothetical protein
MRYFALPPASPYSVPPLASPHLVLPFREPPLPPPPSLNPTSTTASTSSSTTSSSSSSSSSSSASSPLVLSQLFLLSPGSRVPALVRSLYVRASLDTSVNRTSRARLYIVATHALTHYATPHHTTPHHTTTRIHPIQCTRRLIALLRSFLSIIRPHLLLSHCAPRPILLPFS